MKSRQPLALVGLMVLASAFGATCAANNGAGGGGAGDGGDLGGGPASTSDSGGTGGTGGVLMATSGSGGSSGDGGGCVGTSSKANPIPLDIFIMLDQSGSMLMDAGNGMNRWETIQAGITAFAGEPSAAGIGLGVQFFGLPDPVVHGCQQQSCSADGDCMGGCTSCMPQGLCQSPYNPDISSCVGVDYAWAEVPITPLPGGGTAVVTAIAAHAPGTNTPTAPALDGAVQYASAWATANPTHITVVAFATDGEPSECDIDQNNINAIAAAGFAATPSIRTFVIGVGPALTELDGIAAAGGTTTAFHVDTNPSATQDLVDALNTIRGVALGCTYQLPDPPDGMMLDLGLVNVSFDPMDGSPVETFPQVDGAADCGTDDGWYYDGLPPTEIILCPATCDEVSDLISGEVDVVLGCQTIVR